MYSGANDPDSVAAHRDNTGHSKSTDRHHFIAGFKKRAANELGIYDMSGNVAEWCYDGGGQYSSPAEINPVSIWEDDIRIVRGGSVESSSDGDALKVSARTFYKKDCRTYDIGLRIVLGRKIEE